MQKPERAEAPRSASRAAGTLPAALLLAGLLAGPPALAQEPAEPEVDTTASRTLALHLYEGHHYLDALPLLEQLAAEDSDDAQVQEALGFCLLATAATLDDAEERRQMRLRARQALLRSQELGNDTSFVRTLLEQLPPDGSETPFSANPAVDAAMREGEAAFVAGDWEAALTAYHRALALDPTHYEAALFIGDVYFAQQQLEEAVRWFAVAVRNDPNGEAAYRYWGDALMLQDMIKRELTAVLSELPALEDPKRTMLTLYYVVKGKDHGLTANNRMRVELQLKGSGKIRKVVPYSALYYDGKGTPWVYVSTKKLTFERKRVEVERIEGESAVLKSGPEVGTRVATVGVALLYGAEVIFKR